MQTQSFTYQGIPIEVGQGKGDYPYVLIPHADYQSIFSRYLVVDTVINWGQPLLKFKINEEILDANLSVIQEATTKPSEKPQGLEDFEYFYDLEIGAQSMGDAITKQLINGILENSALAINCFSWNGEFLQPISFTAALTNRDIVVTLHDHDATIEKEYSFDNGTTWQDSNTLASPPAGTYDMVVRYKGKELRKGKSFRSVVPTQILIDA